MRTGVKRIEATLHDLGTRNTASVEPDTSTKKALSFRISIGTSEASSSTETPFESELTTQPEENFPPHDNSVQTFPTQEIGCKAPSLPKLKTPNFSSHRNAANPGLAMNILLEIQETVASWQTELQTIVKQIQEIYLEGPIVNGWLESRDRESEPGGTATLRHAEVDRLMDYVEEICTSDDSNVACQSPRAGYRLCGLDTSGRVWSRPCPQEQVASVSVAIARYQKLRQLLGRKQYLETRLAQLAETLVILHGHMQAQ